VNLVVDERLMVRKPYHGHVKCKHRQNECDCEDAINYKAPIEAVPRIADVNVSYAEAVHNGVSRIALSYCQDIPDDGRP
jgi:hypothetical protein